ncbi:MAG: antibiotic biosynthesis monooxygenase [Chloroflexota bacterium]
MLIEMLQFKLKADAHVDAFLQANKHAEDKQVATIPGFLSRQTSVDEDGTWMIIVHWADKAALDKSLATFMEAEATQAFLALMDTDTMSMTVFTVKM